VSVGVSVNVVVIGDCAVKAPGLGMVLSLNGIDPMAIEGVEEISNLSFFAFAPSSESSSSVAAVGVVPKSLSRPRFRGLLRLGVVWSDDDDDDDDDRPNGFGFSESAISSAPPSS